MRIDQPISVQFDAGRATVDLTPFVPGGPKALVEPATIASIVNAAVEYYKDKQVGDWQASVSTDLSKILDKLEEIIDLIHRAVHDIIQNSNENWQDYFATNIEGPGRSWGYYDATKQPLTDTEVAGLISTFRDRLTAAVQSITINGRFKSWGFTLVDVVRIAFVYSMLALKLTNGKLSPRTVRADVGQHVLGYLERSVESSEPMSIANALVTRRLQLTGHVTAMESWCNGWVRVSNVYSRPTNPRRDDNGVHATVVRIGRMSGGASNPTLNETLVVNDGDARFWCSYYPDFPGSIDVDEDEKSRIFCNDRKDKAVTRRNELAQHVSTLSNLLESIKHDIEKIGAWMNG